MNIDKNSIEYTDDGNQVTITKINNNSKFIQYEKIYNVL